MTSGATCDVLKVIHKEAFNYLINYHFDEQNHTIITLFMSFAILAKNATIA